MLSNKSVFEWPITVYLDETDAGGIVHNSNYLKYFERARTEMLRSKGILQRDLMSQNIALVISRMELDYIQAISLDEQLTVLTSIAELKRATMTFCQEIVNDGQVTLCKVMVKVACINTETMKPKAFPRTLHQEISSSDI
ncbi:YbgC/FadM family acyl-CoA thioesterase [Vibrio marisflavi]|uniref:Acyl-CoA thioester hydrolase YbgC n=1 Tax=Vibrio marisflavi CECT 7928 TaxID=634439 RepID=A0ABM9A4A7_9VIBR|nr:YbgC/FadM family acyl-CoA thioesterase [Vibrio marisflavi]CAH0539433.1 Acyl-CoA thioester hydrolase YbgC [Vibrio marisflavi CECT 7928]